MISAPTGRPPVWVYLCGLDERNEISSIVPHRRRLYKINEGTIKELQHRTRVA